MDDAVCPFCSQIEIDLVALKLHIIKGECEVFNELPALDLPS